MRRGLLASRERAHVEIAAGRVTVGGAPATKASRLVAPGEAVALDGPPAPYVSRGGEKLAAALDEFAVPVAGAAILDAGASTGGFTDCLLQRGAAHVVAVDVGRGQLHQRLRTDARVTVVERCNIRHLDLSALDRVGRPFSVVVADLSFISLTTVASALVGLTAPDSRLVVLIKPQFEAGRAEASRGRGVIADPEVWRRVLVEVIGAFDAAGAAMMGLMVSPIRGARGNVEFLAHLVVTGSPIAAHQVVGSAALHVAVDTDVAVGTAVAAGVSLRDENLKGAGDGHPSG
ncbi:MAG: TlyA family RNA methyltransferase [Actinomycetota bacterium]|nr:TlyA family RNA methyltransferase [Actinomycetota bacterium]